MRFSLRSTIAMLAAGIILAGGVAFAQSAPTSEPSPITPPSASGAPGAPAITTTTSVAVSAAEAETYREACLAKIPRRFTPEAHETYCTCTAASIRAHITKTEFDLIQDPKNQKPGILAFEKYVTNVVMPCMEFPVQDIVYLECVLNRNNDPRLKNIPKYCQCMGSRVSEHVKKFGDIDAMLMLGSRFEIVKDPAQAMIRSTTFVQQKNSAALKCLDLRFNR